MKIRDVKLTQLKGTYKYSGTLFEERAARPLDLYPEFRKMTAKDTMSRRFPVLSDDNYLIKQTFLQIFTDDGLTGTIGPLTGDATAYYIINNLKPLLIGQNPLSTEYLWDVMYRSAPNGRMGDNMIAISYIDYALWDIKGKLANLPIHELLGGPVQNRIPVYASMAGFSLEPEKAKMRISMVKKEGFWGVKWFFRRGVSDGIEGEKENLALMRVLREASGPEMKIMIDAWANWGTEYTLHMAKQLKEYNPAWIEEPLHYALHENYARLRADCSIPIAGGEHEYTRWDLKKLMDIRAFDVYQPEPVWTGGVSEMAKIYALATSYDIVLVPHVYLPLASAQVAFTQNSLTTPIFEYHYILGELYQYFLKEPLRPAQGFIYPPKAPGLGIEIDKSKVEEEHDINHVL